jgi:hypothetical protein
MSMLEEYKDDPVALVNAAERLSRNAMDNSGQVERWRDALNAFFGRQTTINPLGVNVNINYLRPKLMTKWARDMQVLVGERPYFPIQADEREAEQAKIREDLLDAMAAEGGFHRALGRTVFLARGLGRAYLEPRITIENNVKTERVPSFDSLTGVQIGERTVRVDNPRIVLRFVSHPPYCVFGHPHGEHSSEKPYVIIKESKSVAEIEEMIDTKRVKLAAGVSVDDLRKSPGKGSPYGEWNDTWRRDLGVLGSSESADVGVFLRAYFNPTKEYPKGRWVFTWNYSILLQDTECLWDNMPPQQKPLVAFHATPVIGPDHHDTLGIWDEISERATLANDMRSIFLNDLVLTIDPWMFYKPDVIAPEAFLRAVRGPIASEAGQSGALKDAVWEVPRQRPPQDVMQMAEKLDGEIDEDVGIFYTQTGSPAPRKETFGATQLLAAAGDVRLETETRDMEQTSFSEVASLCGKLIDSSIMQSDVIRLLGEERAGKFLSADPDTLQYAWRWAFQGSSLVAKKQAENQAMLQHWNLIAQDPGLDPNARFIPLRKIARRLGQYTDEEVDRMHPDPAEQAQTMVPPAVPGMPTPVGGPVAPAQPVVPQSQLNTPQFNQTVEMGA